MKNGGIVSILVGALAAIALGLSSWSLFTVHAQAITLSNIELRLNLLVASEDISNVLKWQGRIQVWTKDEINALRHAGGLPPARWPDRD